MAGGKGKRLLPYTQDCPKPMIPINGKPMLEIILDKCINSGFDNFFISVNYLKEKIVKYFGDGKKWGVNIQYLYEDEPLGTAGPLKLIPGYNNINESILVLNGDIITNLNFNLLTEFHQKHNAYDDVILMEEMKSLIEESYWCQLNKMPKKEWP